MTATLITPKPSRTMLTKHLRLIKTRLLKTTPNSKVSLYLDEVGTYQFHDTPKPGSTPNGYWAEVEVNAKTSCEKAAEDLLTQISEQQNLYLVLVQEQQIADRPPTMNGQHTEIA